MFKFAVSISILAFALCWSASMAGLAKQYAKCEFPEADHAHGVILFRQIGNKKLGRTDLHVHGELKDISVELFKRSPKRGSCGRLLRLVNSI